MDRTHIRWFTKTTVVDLFKSTGLQIVEGGPITMTEPPVREQALQGIRAFAEVIGTDADEAVANASVFQWLVRAIPA